MNKSIIKNRLLLVVFLFFSSTIVFGQAYTFSTFNRVYEPIIGGTQLSNICDWNDLQDLPKVPIGFNFSICGLPLDSVQVSEVFVWHENTEFSPSKAIQIIPFGAGYYCENTTEVSYKTEQLSGQNVFTTEWKNLAFYNDTIGDQFISFQLKFYEDDGAIEIHIGANHMTQDDIFFTDLPGASIIFAKLDDIDNLVINDSSFTLIDDATSPNMVGYYQDYEPYLMGNPDSSRVYRFNRNNLSINHFDQDLIELFPNPTTQYFTVKSNEEVSNIRVLAINGTCLLEHDCSGILSDIDLSELSNGTYFVDINLKSGKKARQQIIKNN